MTHSALVVLLSLPVLMAAPQDGTVLHKIDQFSHPWSSYQVDVQIEQASLRQQWRMSSKENGDFRLEGLSTKEQGRQIFFLEQQLWLVLPDTKRPIKISPQQRLAGQLTGGDLARMRLASEYEVVTQTTDQLNERSCVRLELKAKGPKSSYPRIQFWTTPQLVPLQADYYLKSGKWARTVQFQTPVSNQGRMIISSLKIQEGKNKAVSLSFENWKPLKGSEDFQGAFKAAFAHDKSK